MRFKVRINPVAIADMQEIKAYITEDNPEAAAKMGTAIYSKIEKLADFPEMGVSLGANHFEWQDITKDILHKKEKTFIIEI